MIVKLHLDRSLQFLIATFLQLTSFWGPLRNSFLTHFFRMIFETKHIQKSFLNFATTKPGFRAQNAASWSVTGYSQLAPDFEIPCLGPCWARFGNAGGHLCSFEGFPTESQTHLSHAVWNSRPLLSSCSLSFREGFPEIAWQTSDLYVFDWILFLFLILVSDPLVRFSIFFIAFSCLLVCIVISALWSSHCILGLFEHMTWMILMDSMVFLRWEMIIFLAELQFESWDWFGIWTGLLFATPFWDRRDPVWDFFIFFCSKCDSANN